MTGRKGTLFIIPLFMLILVFTLTNCDDLGDFLDKASDAAEDLGIVDTYDEDSDLSRELSDELNTGSYASFISDDYDEADDEKIPTYTLVVPVNQQEKFEAGSRVFSIVGVDYSAIDKADLPLNNIVGKCYIDVKDYSYTMYFYGENSSTQPIKEKVCELLSGEWTDNTQED